VENLNKKAFAILTLTAMMLAITPLACSQPAPPTLSVWTNKTEYAPGETGILYIRYYNGYSSAVTIKKVYIVFTEWRTYIKGKWEGNLTLEANQAVASHDVFQNETRFTVPSDGRAVSTYVQITIETGEHGTIGPYSDFSISVPSTPRSMDQVVTLFTILLVLVIVSTVIIAAAIFLSARRPQVMWSKEEKVP
jgi:hypothetical protein